MESKRISVKESHYAKNVNTLDSVEQKDNVQLPYHYARFKFEPIKFICENKLDFFQGCIIKYVCRYDAKNGIEDLEKAIRCLEMYIKFLKGDPDWWKRSK